MKRLLFIGMGIALCLGDANATNSETRKFKRFPAKKFETKAQLQQRFAEKEDRVLSTLNVSNVQPATYSNKRSGGGNSVQVSTVSYSDLGKSINPFTSVTAGRNYVSANPTLNTVALFRRGSQQDKPLAEGPGNEMYYDLNTKGGAEGRWQVKRGQIWENATFGPVGAVNYGPRYPQGVLWSAPGQTDTAEAVALTVSRILDGSNDAWGGLGKGWQKLSAGSQFKQALWSSQVDPTPVFHFRTYALDVTSTGAIFTVEPEEDLSSGSVVFTDKVMVHKFTYNSALNIFDSTTTFIPFVNSGQDPATGISDAQLAFGPDGQTGYLVIAGFNPDIAPNFAYTPYVSSTTDGGATWSDFKIYNLNKTVNEYADSSYVDKDAFRNDLLANYMVFNSDSTYYSSDDGAAPNTHAVDYTIMDIDLTVDKFNTPHVFGILCVAGIGDTLAVTGPGFYYPGYGSWNFHFTLKPGTDSCLANVVNQNETLQGCWGDCDTDENINEFNRPHISRSLDGSIIVMSWYDTDLIANPQTRDENNSNPDLWVRSLRVVAPNEFVYSAQARNMTKGSDYAGLAILGSVAPTLMNTPNGHALASTIALLSDYDPVATTALWEISHLYLNGVNISASPDSFTIPRPGRLVTTDAKQLVSNKNADLGLSLVPNPSRGAFTAHINVANSGTADVKVVNSIGQTVENFSQSVPKGGVNMALNFKNLKQGVYFLSVRVGTQVSTQRFVKE